MHILFEGIGKSTSLIYIYINCAALSVFLNKECNHLALAIIIACKMFSKTDTQLVHCTSSQ